MRDESEMDREDKLISLLVLLFMVRIIVGTRLFERIRTCANFLNNYYLNLDCMDIIYFRLYGGFLIIQN